MSTLHRPDAAASLTTLPTTAPCLEGWYMTGVLHDVGKIAVSETALYRIQPLTSG